MALLKNPHENFTKSLYESQEQQSLKKFVRRYLPMSMFPSSPRLAHCRSAFSMAAASCSISRTKQEATNPKNTRTRSRRVKLNRLSSATNIRFLLLPPPQPAAAAPRQQLRAQRQQSQAAGRSSLAAAAMKAYVRSSSYTVSAARNTCRQRAIRC